MIIFPANATDAYDYDPAAPFDSWVGLGNQDDTTVDYNDDGDEMSPEERLVMMDFRVYPKNRIFGYSESAKKWGTRKVPRQISYTRFVTKKG